MTLFNAYGARIFRGLHTCVGGDASFTDNYENIQQSQEKDDREVTKE